MSEDSPIILVPAGFSEQSILALDQALVFAKAMKAKITLLTVVEDNKQFRKLLNTESRGDALKSEVNAKLKELASEYSNRSGVEISTMVAKGVVYEEVARVCELIDAEMVIMGTNGKPQNFRKRFIGSNAYRVATLVKPPVITIKGVRNIQKIETIIFPLVLDRRSKEKVGPALKYARLFKSAIKIVSVLGEGQDEKILRAHLNQVKTFISDHGVDCTAEMIKPTEQKGVVRNTLYYAYENDGDLIIITEDDKDRDLSDYFLGTDVQAMVYHSEIPVMCITPSEVKWESMWESF